VVFAAIDFSEGGSEKHVRWFLLPIRGLFSRLCPKTFSRRKKPSNPSIPEQRQKQLNFNALLFKDHHRIRTARQTRRATRTHRSQNHQTENQRLRASAVIPRDTFVDSWLLNALAGEEQINSTPVFTEPTEEAIA
jgi:hypothetical protein